MDYYLNALDFLAQGRRQARRGLRLVRSGKAYRTKRRSAALDIFGSSHHAIIVANPSLTAAPSSRVRLDTNAIIDCGTNPLLAANCSCDLFLGIAVNAKHIVVLRFRSFVRWPEMGVNVLPNNITCRCNLEKASEPAFVD